ncbi:hypothetical protein [Maridesulfovibrio ferrireducens]|uniref:hypothetical protein n=1 Tax=Maridesulfovibrio ferrireducens TaxID=246191 RepID=UPI001A20D2B2|nr:hypothetical protein [Maridesulfovibrio ferrireducens]MBI9109876.1 hypothetical protein [Maridesulfovibrio ferrireducens]
MSRTADSKHIAVIIRVYSRVDDAKALVQIIQQYWKKNKYTLFIAHNGANDGYILDEEIRQQAEVIDVTENSGHLSGATDLVKKSYAHIQCRQDIDYVLFIESDFWIFDDALINEGILSGADIATTIWIEKRKSLGVDFFLIKKSYIAAHPEILKWEASPETDMRNFAHESKAKIYIFNGLRPVHVPALMRNLFEHMFSPIYYAGGRFRLFSKHKALSHHIEDLPKGMHTKKAIANALVQEIFFADIPLYPLSFIDLFVQRIARYVPQSSWYRRFFIKY